MEDQKVAHAAEFSKCLEKMPNQRANRSVAPDEL
jgi:hypothetical protein